MKSIVVVSVIVFLTVSEQKEFKEVLDDYTSLIAPIRKACLAESQAHPQLVDKLLYNGEYVEDMPVKCYLKCLYLKLQMLNENGDIDAANVKKNAGVPEEAVQNKIYENCKGVTGADLCEKAFNLSKCTYTTVKGSTT